MTDPAPASGVDRNRLESISDGIMAVAITLLVLGIDAPTRAPGESLWQALDAGAIGSLALFALSFAVIARFWLVHHDVFRHLPQRVPGRVVALNFAALLGICLVPFATTLFGRNGQDLGALVVYAGTFAIISLLLSAVRGGGRLVLDAPTVVHPAVFLAAIPVALVASPALAPLTWCAFAFVPRLIRRGDGA